MPRIPRTTTVGSLKTYRYNLNRSSYTMGKAMEKVDTQRNFNSFAEDPASASRCFQLRRAYLRTSAQYTINDAVYRKYQQAWDCLDSVEDDLDTYIEGSSSFTDVIISLNGPDYGGHNALGQDLIAKADSIIQTLNGRFGENFIFAGADTLNVPFTWTAKENPAYIDPATADPANPDHAAAFQFYKLKDDVVQADFEAAFKHADGSYPAPGDANYDAFMENFELTNDETAANAFQMPEINSEYDEQYTSETDQKTLAGTLTGDELKAAQADPRYGKFVNKPGPNTNTIIADTKMVSLKNEAYNEDTTYKYLKNDRTGTNDKSEAGRMLCYRGVPVDENDNEKMRYFLREENKYMDIGLGYQEKDGKAVSSSVFDAGLQGAFYLGNTGTTSETVTYYDKEYTFDGIPNNIVSVMEELGQILLRCDKDNGAYPSEEEGARALALARRFEDTSKLLKQRYVELDTQSGFLRDNGELLVENCDTLSEQFLGMEDVNAAGAISDFMYAKYVYDTALKVGNSILSQSLMDYLNL